MKRSAEGAGPGEGRRRDWLVAALGLFVLYGALSLVMDPHGYLGTDTGAKVATLEAMQRSGSARPDVGYWAERWDPDGDLHPMRDATSLEGHWVAVTTLPVLEAARPLYGLGGYRGALVLPMLGSVASAGAAAALAGRLGAGRRRRLGTFWATGLASPMVVYALDFWEHSIGVALVAWSALLLDDVARGRRALWWAGAAGAGFAAAATLRNEALVYGAATLALAAWRWWVRRRGGEAVGGALVRSAVSWTVGFAVVFGANAALEAALAGQARGERATSTATGAGSELADRLREAAVTLTGFKGDSWGAALFGAAVVAAVAGVVVALLAGRLEAGRAVRVLGGLVVVMAVAGLASPSFVPGLLVAYPLATVGLVAGVAGRGGAVPGPWWAWAVGSLPVVWAFQFLGGAGPQWGGRYTLPSALVLGALGAVALRRLPLPAARAVLALSLVVSATGLWWLQERSHALPRFFDEVDALDGDVVVARDEFLLREAGPRLLDRRWLSVGDEDEFRRAAEVAVRADAATLVVLDPAGAPPSPGPGWHLEGRTGLELLDDAVVAARYRRVGA